MPSDICTNSSIHGICYIFNSHHSKATRVFWSFSFLCSILGFSFYIISSYVKTFIDPDFGVRINQRLSYEIPFPAITVCNPLFARDKTVDVRKYYQIAFKSENYTANLSKTECEYFAANSHWCLPNYAEYSTCDDDPNKIGEFLEKSSLSTEEFFVACTFGLKFQNCSEMFNMILTDRYGLCYSYNMQDYRTIFREGISEDFMTFKGEMIEVTQVMQRRI